MKSSEIVDFVRSVPRGKIIGIEWVKSDGSIRKGACMFGVRRPHNSTVPGEGVRKGVSFSEAVENGVLKFYDITAKNRNGGLGDYRSAKLNRILSVTYKGRYDIEDNQQLLN